MRTVFTIALMGLFFFAGAQRFSSEVFHKGLLVTTAKDTLKGKLQYDMEANVLSVVTGGKIKTFSSHKILYFEFNDEILKTFRQFYALPFKVNYDYEIPIFFELLYEGPFSLLTREEVIQRTQTNASPYWVGTPFTQTELQYRFYFLDQKGKIMFYSGRKNDLLRIMARKQSRVKKFIKDNKLDVDDMRDLIRITAFYNSI